MNSRFISAFLLSASIGTAVAQPFISNDQWDISQGSVVTASSDLIPGYTAGAMFGEFGHYSGGNSWTYFNDGLPPGTVHFVEWQTPADVTVRHVRLFAFGDGGSLNNGREFAQFTLKAMSAGSLTYDVTLINFTPTHPYTFIDESSALILDQLVTPTTARSFRAEFTQYTAGNFWDGPRIVELDAIPLPPPEIAAQPISAVVNFAMPALFSVNASGTGVLQYQWFKDGSPIAGQTSSSLRIASVTAADVGGYSVTITDANGSITSAPATLTMDLLNIQQSFADLWDVKSGATLGAASAYYPGVGSPEGMFGGVSAIWESDWTYFGDNQPTGAVHHVEWTIPTPASVRTIRLFAHGDPWLNNSREFEKLTIKAKSVGSSTFDRVVATFTPTHPYTFLDNDLILDTEITPIVASAFRAEFVQHTAGYGYDGPRIIELDAFSTRPLVRPTILTNPESKTVAKNSAITFTVLARGGNITYQWKFMGQNITGETNATLKLKSAKSTDQGYYTVTVSNAAGSVESTQALLLVTK